MKEIFPKSGQVSVPLSNLFEEYMLLFDEPEKAIHSEVKADDNKIDHLKKIINEAANGMESEAQGTTEKLNPSDRPASYKPPIKSPTF